MRRVLVGFVVAIGALVGSASSAHAQIALPPLPLPPLPPLPSIPGLPPLLGNQQVSAYNNSTDRRFALTVATDPIEDLNFPIVLGIARPETPNAAPVQRMIVTAKRRDPGASCAAARISDPGDVRLDVPTPGDFTRNILQGILIRDPGDYLLCGYLQNADDDAKAVLTVSNQITVRSPKGTLDLGAPSSVPTGQSFQVTAAGTEEVERSAVATLRPLAAGPPTCGATADDERRYGADVIGGQVLPGSDPTTLTATVPGQTVPGQMLLCGYLGEGFDDPAPEETASRTIDVIGPTACQTGQAALAQAQASAQAALAAATLRGMHVDSAKARLELAQDRLKRTTGKKARRTQTGRVRGAQELVAEQTGLLAAAQGASAAQQSSFAAQRAATATLCGA